MGVSSFCVSTSNAHGYSATLLLPIFNSLQLTKGEAVLVQYGRRDVNFSTLISNYKMPRGSVGKEKVLSALPLPPLKNLESIFQVFLNC